MKVENILRVDFETGFIKKMNWNDPITSKQALIQVLDVWLRNSKNDDIGNPDLGNNNAPWVLIEFKNQRYYINRDTKRSGVEKAMKKLLGNWYIVENTRGVRNKVVFEDRKAIPKFYLYRQL